VNHFKYIIIVAKSMLHFCWSNVILEFSGKRGEWVGGMKTLDKMYCEKCGKVFWQKTEAGQ
jgi:hypothetical protein